jgi:hypothetical protein
LSLVTGVTGPPVAATLNTVPFRREQNPAVLTPATAASLLDVGNCLRQAAGDLDRAQFAFGEERHRAAVG